MDDWENACGPIEVVARTRILLQLWSERFDPDALPPDVIDVLLVHQLGREQDRARSEAALAPLERAHASYDSFTVSLAHELVETLEPGTVGDLLARAYAGDSGGLWRRLATPAYAGTTLRARYEAEIDRLRRPRPRAFFAAHAGFLRGRDGLDDLHGQALLGVQVGAQQRRARVRMVFDLRLGGLSRDYEVRDGEKFYLTKSLSGAGLLVEPSLRVLRLRSAELSLVLGVGWTGAEALPPEPENDIPARWIHSFPLAVGADLRWWWDRGQRRFVEVQFRRETTDWDTGPGASTLDGGSWQWRVAFGVMSDRDRDRRRLLGVADPDDR